MVGQNKIKSLINAFSYAELPHSILIIGDKGMGKHTVIEYISAHYNIPLVDVSTEISKDTIDDIYLESVPCIYVIDLALANRSKKILNLQNAILKLVEEPPNNCKIIILAETENQVLPTILNRCQRWVLERYSLPEMRLFNSELSDESLTLLSTPGNIKFITCEELNSINSLCDNIITNIHRASISNVLSIMNNINFSNDIERGFDDIERGYDIEIFNRCLRYKLSRTNYDDAFFLVKRTMEDYKILNINKKYLFENFLLELKGIFNEIRRV